MAKRYRSDALAAVHETARGLREVGVMDKRTMKAFDAMCLTPVEKLSPDRIRAIRRRKKASQAVA